MARKKKPKKTSWLKIILLFIFVPLTVWFLAFIAWLYWDDIARLVSGDAGRGRSVPRASRRLEKDDNKAVPKQELQEKLLDDDRKQLEDVLKQRQ